MRNIFLITLFLINTTFGVTIDGARDGSGYTLLGSTPSTYQDGFGGSGQLGNGTANTGTLYYAQDATYIYIFIVSQLPTDASNGLGLWVNFSNLTGTASGTALGVSGGGHYIGGYGGANVSYKADFEVDYQFAFNTGGGSSNIYCDARKQVATATNSYLGSSDQSGGTESSQGTDFFADADFSFAFNNSGGTDKGCEIQIKKSAVGNPTGSDNMQLFAFIVSSTSYFSNTCAPGNAGAANLGNDIDYSSISGQDLFTASGDASLPVTLTSFDATNKKGTVELSWVTESEIDNLGFLIERAVDGSAFEEIANFKFDEALRGQGSTTARTDYVWVDKQVVPGVTYEYVLADVDINQKVVRHTDNTVRIKAELNDEQVGIAAGFKLANVAPNPFNPSTEIHFALNDDLANNPYTITILDITGREVQKLSGLATSGINVAKWNGQLSTGNLATSGIYFARINVDNVSQVVKMTLMR